MEVAHDDNFTDSFKTDWKNFITATDPGTYCNQRTG